MNGNRYLTRASDGNVLFITTTGNVLVSSWAILLVNIPFLDLSRFTEFAVFSTNPLGKTQFILWETEESSRLVCLFQK